MIRAALLAGVAWWGKQPSWLRWSAVAAGLVAIWWSSSSSPVARPPSAWRALLHNGAHIVAFGGVAALVTMAIAGARAPSRRAAWWSLAFTAVQGAIDEIHQSFVPGRVSSVGDWVTDVCGACLAIGVLSLVHEPTVARRRAVVLWACAAVAMACAATWLPI